MMIEVRRQREETLLLWRRFTARLFDFLGFLIPCYLLTNRYLVDANQHSLFILLIEQFVAAALMLLIEPFMIHCFKTTPGKALFRLKITDETGGRLSYKRAFKRSFSIWQHALGFGLPFYRLVVLARLYTFRDENSPRIWEEYAL